MKFFIQGQIARQNVSLVAVFFNNSIYFIDIILRYLSTIMDDSVDRSGRNIG